MVVGKVDKPKKIQRARNQSGEIGNNTSKANKISVTESGLLPDSSYMH